MSKQQNGVKVMTESGYIWESNGHPLSGCHCDDCKANWNALWDSKPDAFFNAHRADLQREHKPDLGRHGLPMTTHHPAYFPAF